MTDKTTPIALAERCEAAKGPDRGLDAEIAPLTGLRVVDEGHPLGRCCYDKSGHGVRLPAFTASIDAALTLVDERAGVCLRRFWVRKGERWACALSVGVTRSDDAYCEEATSGPLAICAAALRARAAQEADSAG